MLDVSRMESGTISLLREDVDLVALTLEVLKSMVLLAQHLEVNVHAERPMVASVDRDLLRRVIANLVGNAFKFAPSLGHVTVRFSEADGVIRVEVIDDGRGIAAADHARIFQKFGQVDTDRKKSGSGLGLTFAKMAVEAHGGAIGVISAPGEGSTFWFTLPIQ